MKKYIAFLLCGAMLVGFTACEDTFDPVKDKDNIPAFCNSLLGLSLEEVEQQLKAQGFADAYGSTNKEYIAEMGPYKSTAVACSYSKENTVRDKNGTWLPESSTTYITINWVSGEIRKLHYQISTNAASLREVALESEEGLHKIAKQNHWEIQYLMNMGREYSRKDVTDAIKDNPLGYCSFGMCATDLDFPQSLLYDDTAYGISYTQKVGVDSMGDWTLAYIHNFVYQLEKEFRFIPQALYMPNDTIRVGEYLHKASDRIEDFAMDEKRLHYSVYNDEHFFYSDEWENGCFYACGFAYFAPAGALDLEANKVTHTSSDESILKVEQDECQAGKEFYEKIRIKAVAPGIATLTVRWKHLSTTATITVVE